MREEFTAAGCDDTMFAGRNFRLQDVQMLSRRVLNSPWRDITFVSTIIVIDLIAFTSTTYLCQRNPGAFCGCLQVPGEVLRLHALLRLWTPEADATLSYDDWIFEYYWRLGIWIYLCDCDAWQYYNHDSWCAAMTQVLFITPIVSTARIACSQFSECAASN